MELNEHVRHWRNSQVLPIIAQPEMFVLLGRRRCPMEHVDELRIERSPRPLPLRPVQSKILL